MMKVKHDEDRLKNKKQNSSHQVKNILIIPTRSGFEFVKKQQISYVSAARAYCQVHLTDGRQLLVSKSLKQMEQDLHTPQFFRVHHSYLVNVQHVLRMLKKEGDCLQLFCGNEIPLAHSRRESFIKFVQAFH